MKIKNDAEVYTQDGEKIGEVSRVVMHPGDYEVTHIIVEKGFLFHESKVVPIDKVSTVDEDRITLHLKEDELDQLHNLVETEFIPGDTTRAYQNDVDRTYAPRPVYWYPPAGTAWWTHGGYPSSSVPRFTSSRELQVPDDTVVLEEGAKVISSEGEHVGDIEDVLIDPETNRATHLIISEGFLLKDKKCIPTLWIKDVSAEEVHLTIDANRFDDIPEYEENE